MPRIARSFKSIRPAWAGFDNFGADGLDFVLIAVVPDVNKVGDARSDLRIRIFKAFREAGIEIPFPQRDIHLRDLDGLRAAMTRMAEERARNAPARNDDAVPAPPRKPNGD